MANDTPFYEGVRRKDIAQLNKRKVDVRTFSEKLSDSLSNSSSKAKMVLVAIIIFSIGYDVSLRFLDVGFIFLSAYLFIFNNLGSKRKLLFRAPMSSGKLVPNFKKDEAKYIMPNGEEATGLYYFGQDVEDGFVGEELWLSDDDVRKHMLLFGTTGAGKTEALLSLCYGALISCSGFIFSDGKGTFELYYKVHNTCRSLGQEDDLLLMSFLTGAEDVRKATSQKISNTLNPVAKASQDAASQLIVSLMASNSGGSGDMWSERAAVLMESVMGFLTWQRDVRKKQISIDSIRDTLVLSTYHEIWFNAQGIDDENHPQYLSDFVMKAMNGYLVSLPGFAADKPFDQQESSVSEQHGYLFMQFSKLLGSLADMYGYIFNTQLSEIDFWDVVVNRRILVILLPALAKSKQELSMLGKIVIACIKQMMSSGLGKYSEGFAGEMAKANPTKSPTPCITILDEFGYYAVAGSAVMPAQARSLGFFMVFAGQDFAAFSASGKEEAEAIVANCKLQVCMALQDEKSTFDIFHKKAGQASVYTGQGKVYRNGKLENQETVSLETKDVITFNDLSRQKSGFAHFFLESDMARGRFFYAAIPIEKHHQVVVNQFVKVLPPEPEFAEELNKSFDSIYNLITNIQYHESMKDELAESTANSRSQDLAYLLHNYRNVHRGSSLLATCATIAHTVEAYTQQTRNNQEKISAKTNGFKNNQINYIKENASYKEELEEYKRKQETAGVKAVPPLGMPEAFASEEMEDIVRIVSDNDNVNKRNVDKTIANINRAGNYPKASPSQLEPKSIAKVVQELNQTAIQQSEQRQTTAA